MYPAWPSRVNLTFPTLHIPSTSWRWMCHSVLKACRLWILSLGPVSFAPTMACSVVIGISSHGGVVNPIWCWGRPLRADLVCTSVNQAAIAIGRWYMHGFDVLLLAVDSVQRQYQAEPVFVVGFVYYYGRYRCYRGIFSKSTTVVYNVVD